MTMICCALRRRLWAAVVVVPFMLAGCGEDESGSFSCKYDTRRTSCGSSGFGAWESKCVAGADPNNLKDGWTPQQYCQNLAPANDTECAGGCCINFQFRNVQTINGDCSGGTSGGGKCCVIKAPNPAGGAALDYCISGYPDSACGGLGETLGGSGVFYGGNSCQQLGYSETCGKNSNFYKSCP